MNGGGIQGDLRPRYGLLFQDRACLCFRLSDVCGVDGLEPEREECLGSLSPSLSPDIGNRYL
jgi:hypothetical protein